MQDTRVVNNTTTKRTARARAYKPRINYNTVTSCWAEKRGPGLARARVLINRSIIWSAPLSRCRVPPVVVRTGGALNVLIFFFFLFFLPAAVVRRGVPAKPRRGSVRRARISVRTYRVIPRAGTEIVCRSGRGVRDVRAKTPDGPETCAHGRVAYVRAW